MDEIKHVCFICCDPDQRENYEKIKKIKVIGAVEELNGTYYLCDELYKEYPEYKKCKTPEYTLFFSGDRCHWVFLYVRVGVSQFVKCPMNTQWKQCLNTYSYDTLTSVKKIKVPFYVVSTDNAKHVKPAKKY